MFYEEIMAKERDQLKITFVGHMDHGKSTLIGRLLYDTDSLPPDRLAEIRQRSKELGHETEFAYFMDNLREERERGMTIDIAQTFFRATGRDYVIIDAPGHKEFLKNMLTGATQADAAALLVDVAEGVQEQTRRHGFLLSLLGLRQNVVLLNKVDLVGFDRKRCEEVEREIVEFLSRAGIQPAFVIPISAKHGDNVARRSKQTPWYSGPTFLEALSKFDPPALQNGSFRFPVQDVYTWLGGPVVVGRVEAGSVTPGATAKVLPDGTAVRVERVMKFLSADLDRAGQGSCIGLVVDRPDLLGRGKVLCGEGPAPAVSREVQARMFWMSAEQLSKGETYALRCATQETPCKVGRIFRRINTATLAVEEEEAESLGETDLGEVILTLDRPMVVEDYLSVPELGRFVLERNNQVVAAGIVRRP